MVKKVRQLSHNQSGLPRNQPLQVAAEGKEQLRLIDNVRERDDGKNEQRNNRQQRVVSDSARQKKPLIGTKALQRLDRESTGMLPYNAGVRHNTSLTVRFWQSPYVNVLDDRPPIFPGAVTTGSISA